MKFDPSDPLMRIVGESSKANQALRDYAFLGPGRSFAKLLKKYRSWAGGEAGEKKPVAPPTRRKSTIENWSVKYHWQARVAAWQELQDLELEYLVAARRRELLDLDWTLGGDLRLQVLQFLAELPKFLEEETIEEIDPVSGDLIIKKYVKLNTNLGELGRVAKLATEIQRLAVDMPTDNINVSGNVLDQLIERQLAQLAHRGEEGAAGPLAPDQPES